MDTTFNLENILSFSSGEDNNPEIITDNLDTNKDTDSNTDDIDDELEGDDQKTIEEDTEKKTAEADESNDEDENAAVKAYYDFLVDSKLIQPDEDFKFDGTIESLEKAKAQTEKNLQKQTFQAIIQSLPDEMKSLLEFASKGGKDLKSFWKYTTVDSYDLNDENEQIRVVRDYYKETSKFSDDKINRLIKNFKDNDELEEEAKDALDALNQIKADKKQNAIRSLEEQRELEQKAQSEYRDKVYKTIDKLEYIPKERKGKVKAFMFNVITKQDGTLTDYQRAFQNISSNSEHLAQLADLLLDYSPDKGFSYERFKNKGRTEATQDFKKRLEQASSNLKPNQTSKKAPGKTSSTFDWEAFLSL